MNFFLRGLTRPFPALASLFCGVLLLGTSGARADNSRFALSSGNFAQDWSNPGLITADNDWGGVPSIVGYNGANVTGPITNVDSLTGDYSAPQYGGPAVRANQQQILVGPDNGGVAEYEQVGSIALRGVNAATSAPHLIAYLDSRNRQDLKVSFDVIDIDGVNNTDANVPSNQFIALQYRVGNSGKFTTVANANNSIITRFGAGATGLKTSFSQIALPAPANNQADVQIRIITADQIGTEDWIAIDNIVVSSSASVAPPSVAPVATSDSATTDEDTAVVIPVLDNDSDADTSNADLRVATISNLQNGKATGVGTRSVTFTPGTNLNNSNRSPFSFDYNMVDPEGNYSNTVTVTVAVAPVNDAPTVTSLVVTPLALVDGSFSATARATDPESNPITYNFSVRRPDGTELFSLQNTTGSATFNLSSVSGEVVGDGLVTQVTASDGTLTSAPASGTTFVTSLQVTSLDESPKDDTLTSLREAVAFANLNSDSSTIVFAATLRGTLTLTQGQLILTAPTSISGPGARFLLVSGNNASRHFLIRSGVVANLSGLSFINGAASDSGEFAGEADRSGGSIVNYGTLTLDNCAFLNNVARAINLPNTTAGFSRGGALLNVGTLTARGCLFAGNSSIGGVGGNARGGAIDLAYGGTFSNCTFTGNAASGGSNATTEGGAIFSFDTSTFSNVTVVGNAVSNQSSTTPGPTYGGGLSGSVTLQNSLVAGNTRNSGPGAGPDGAGTFNGNSNLIGNTAGGTFSGSNNLPNVSDPKVGQLSDNGGPTDTMALLGKSPAIDAGSSTLTVDQRGTVRPQGRATDIGAFEVAVPVATSGALISEFRLSGPSGPADEFIEIANPTVFPLDLTGWRVGSALAGAIIPKGKIIPANGHLLVIGNQYSLANYGATGAGAGDLSFGGDIATGATLLLRNAANTIVDQVNPANLPAPNTTHQYSYLRRLDSGVSQDTDNDANDFNLVDVQNTTGPNNVTGISQGLLRLGAPGPKNLASPVPNNSLISFTPATAVPASVRVGSGNSGTLALRYVVTNKAGNGKTMTALRFRVVALTAGTTDPPDSPAADLRLISSTASGAILPFTLQEPPSQPNGGGLNATVSLLDLNRNGGIAPGQSVTVELLFNVVQKGTYRFLLNVEPVLIAAPSTG